MRASDAPEAPRAATSAKHRTFRPGVPLLLQPAHPWFHPEPPARAGFAARAALFSFASRRGKSTDGVLSASPYVWYAHRASLTRMRAGVSAIAPREHHPSPSTTRQHEGHPHTLSP